MTFERFEDINSIGLRVFNRVVYLNNLISSSGSETSKRYIESFTEGERKQMYIMNAYIQQKGLDNVRRELTKGLVIVDEIQS